MSYKFFTHYNYIFYSLHRYIYHGTIFWNFKIHFLGMESKEKCRQKNCDEMFYHDNKQNNRNETEHVVHTNTGESKTTIINAYF